MPLSPGPSTSLALSSPPSSSGRSLRIRHGFGLSSKPQQQARERKLRRQDLVCWGAAACPPCALRVCHHASKAKQGPSRSREHLVRGPSVIQSRVSMAATTAPWLGSAAAARVSGFATLGMKREFGSAESRSGASAVEGELVDVLNCLDDDSAQDAAATNSQSAVPAPRVSTCPSAARPTKAEGSALGMASETSDLAQRPPVAQLLCSHSVEQSPESSLHSQHSILLAPAQIYCRSSHGRTAPLLHGPFFHN
ncbi:hypothetical protein BZA05DRAFT_166573 [Tricharina praecox]|uniref:uncharacterized protein n=1 Tax=Tricharina praecox TaxID=43433 RepID=UPI00221F19E9|nr:uncharacterized protein BZA05DRAFT_166573 [Tricharina praecox]KAI5857113.1 hypothetical protein BZA05DRAFT_166573 [Tricharina praecox]